VAYAGRTNADSDAHARVHGASATDVCGNDSATSSAASGAPAPRGSPWALRVAARDQEPPFGERAK